MKKKLFIALLVIIVLLFLGSSSYYLKKKNILFPNKTLQRQAVFLTNGQVYFGYIQSKNENYLVLKNIYYLQSQDVILNSDANTSQKKISIVKLGSELHGPEDVMYINKENILFYEDMRNNSKINDAIEKYIVENQK
ncbi:MAG: hypothetical protein WCW17_04465 [Patescibacteria group bacterium]|jgi:hypothetical protein